MTSDGQPFTYLLDIVIESDREYPVTVKVDGRVVVGRVKGDATDIGLNLSPYGASERGVSRQHMAFDSDVRGVYIEDLMSTSGTRINGALIKPNVRYRLRPEDEITLGMMRLTVRLIRNAGE